MTSLIQPVSCRTTFKTRREKVMAKHRGKPSFARELSQMVRNFVNGERLFLRQTTDASACAKIPWVVLSRVHGVFDRHGGGRAEGHFPRSTHSGSRLGQ